MTSSELIDQAMKGYLSEKTGTRLVNFQRNLSAEWMGDRVVIRSQGLRVAAVFGLLDNKRVELDGNKYNYTTSRHQNLIKARSTLATLKIVEPF